MTGFYAQEKWWSLRACLPSAGRWGSTGRNAEGLLPYRGTSGAVFPLMGTQRTLPSRRGRLAMTPQLWPARVLPAPPITTSTPRTTQSSMNRAPLGRVTSYKTVITRDVTRVVDHTIHRENTATLNTVSTKKMNHFLVRKTYDFGN